MARSDFSKYEECHKSLESRQAEPPQQRFDSYLKPGGLTGLRAEFGPYQCPVQGLIKHFIGVYNLQLSKTADHIFPFRSNPGAVPVGNTIRTG